MESVRTSFCIPKNQTRHPIASRTETTNHFRHEIKSLSAEVVVNLHVRNNHYCLRHIFLRHTIRHSSIQNLHKCTLQICAVTNIGKHHGFNLFRQSLARLNLNIMRTIGKGHIGVLKSTLIALGKINCQANRSSHRTTIHRTAYISHNQYVILTLDVIGQSLPLSFNNRIFLETLHNLFYQVIRIQSGSINLLFTLFDLFDISIESRRIMTLKSLTITIHCYSRHRSIINISPLTSRHLYLNYLEVITQTRKSLTILALSQAKRMSSLTT